MYLSGGMFYESLRGLIVNELHVPSLHSLDAKERWERWEAEAEGKFPPVRWGDMVSPRILMGYEWDLLGLFDDIPFDKLA